MPIHAPPHLHLLAFFAAARVVVMGATNRPDSLDEALRRPGRFDREVGWQYSSEALVDGVRVAAMLAAIAGRHHNWPCLR